MNDEGRSVDADDLGSQSHVSFSRMKEAKKSFNMREPLVSTINLGNL